MTEAEVRQLRDKVFLTRISDDDWRRVMEFWTRPAEVAWLQEQIERMEARTGLKNERGLDKFNR